MDERNRDFAGMAAAVRRLADEGQKRQDKEPRSLYEEQQVEDVSKVLSAIYDRTAAYTSAIIIAGYAGFFVAWSNLRHELPKEEMVNSALAMSISLILFVLWETVKMVVTTLRLQTLRKEVLAAPPEAAMSKLQKLRRAEARLNLRLGYCWLFVLAVVIVFGLGAGGILLNAFLRQLLY